MTKHKFISWLISRFVPGAHVVYPCNMGMVGEVMPIVFVYKCLFHPGEEFFLYTSEGIDRLKPMVGVKFSFEDGE